MKPNEKPKQDLVMEVLAARYRLGEALWTFRDMHSKTLRELEAAGYVEVMHGIVDGTVRAMLTEKGRDAYLSASYSPPAVDAYFADVRAHAESRLLADKGQRTIPPAVSDDDERNE